MNPDDVFEVLGRHMLVDGFHLVMDLAKSKGSWMEDARDGKRYLDFYSFFATAPAATRATVSRALARPPPRKSRSPYFLSYV